jgi:hypothetical protein
MQASNDLYERESSDSNTDHSVSEASVSSTNVSTWSTFDGDAFSSACTKAQLWQARQHGPLKDNPTFWSMTGLAIERALLCVGEIVDLSTGRTWLAI